MKKPRISGGLAEVEDTKRNKLMHFDVGESLYKWPIQRFSGTKKEHFGESKKGRFLFTESKL